MDHLSSVVFFGFFMLGILLIVINELREWRINAKFEIIADNYIDLQDTIESVETRIRAEQLSLCSEVKRLENTLGHLQGAFKDFHESLAINKRMTSDLKVSVSQFEESFKVTNEFINKASVDLATIVNEYKINGIPLGYQRKPHVDPYDLVEGL